MEHEVFAWAQQFSLLLVGLALLVCAAGSVTVMALLERAIAAKADARWLWLAGVCIGFGADVWATHFIAMLAYDPKTAFGYRVGPTILSVVIAIAGSALPFAALIFHAGSRRTRILAGLALGLVIGAMHFVGMSAMQMAMPSSQSASFVIAGLAAGMIFCALAFGGARRSYQPGCGLFSTLLLMLAICSLHFIAMGGYSIAMPAGSQASALADVVSAPFQSSTTLWLALTVAGVSGLILLSGFSAVVTDLKFVALRQREAATLEHFARHDELTNLPNRLYLRESLAQAVAGPPEIRSFALFYIDLDRFKSINDLFGHQAGDMLLAEVAERIQRLIRDTDMAARFGGDEFIILQRGCDLPPQAAALAERLVRRLAEPVALEGRAVQVGASVGIAFYPADAGGIEEVIRNADIALYRAKSDGGGCFRFFEPRMSEHLLLQRHLQQDLLTAFEQAQFELVYQPIFACETSRLTGFEALLRWRHPERGMISPMEFIPFAEKSGLIVKLGLWALEAACIEAATWPDWVMIAVNLSPVQLRREDIDEAVLAVLRRTGLPAARLELEVTESAVIESPEQARAAMASLKSHGVRFAIDDFGTGYSSLGSLSSFPFDRIKIDRSFVHGLENDPDLAAIVRAVISLGESLQIGVLAEGVETEEQLALLRGQNCGHVQGYLLGRPMPGTEIAKLIALHEAAATANPLNGGLALLQGA